MNPETSFPRLAARTRTFTLGAPRTVAVSGDGERVVFLRSAGPTDPVHALWVFDVGPGTERVVADPRAFRDSDDEDLPPEEKALRERRREAGGGIVSYATDEETRTAVFTLGGKLFRIGLLPGDEPTPVELPVAGPVLDPRPSPSGEHVAYVTGGALHVLSRTDEVWTDRVVVAEDGVSWGVAEFAAAEEMNRFRGYWWSPDSSRILAARVDESPVQTWYIADPAQPGRPPSEIRYPQAGSPNAVVSLHVFALAGGRLDLSWDSAEYPYLVTGGWDDSGCPLFTVMDRRQSAALVLGADPDTGELTTHSTLSGAPWLEVLPGTPVLLGDGRLVLGSSTADARQLSVGGVTVTPTGLYVRRYVGQDGADFLVEGTEDAPEQNHVYRVGPDGTARRVTEGVGWFSAVSGGATTVEIRRTLDTIGVRYAVGDHVLESSAAAPPFVASPVLTRVTDRRLPAAVLYPRDHTPGTRLPVLMDPYGGPHHQEVMAAGTMWLEPQWWADQGFAVVVVDGRGTPGVSPSFEEAIRLDFAGPVLDDQVDGLLAVAKEHPDLDLGRVGIRGWSFGGYLAALAVLRRPDVFHAGIAGAPVTDWVLYDTFYTERYLGLPSEQPDAYRRSSLIPDADKLSRPLMIVHGLADDNVVAAHTLQLSSALLAAGRPHEVLPLTGITHMATDETVKENLLLLQLDFLRRSLSS
ncbi:S9 family peptidase [Cryptosporangium phraense]|uniref:S9 family peptidase n=1 Tax=Cryptosporangium phraense TaxID=2593070 RepID=A0A545B1A2_9ACTN|nr:prolyl oligopeptidase family serine peptidase [Cryptosporangium phraense]TQS46615.1 S9 family peptidase [Cryptosporangium phraense]